MQLLGKEIDALGERTTSEDELGKWANYLIENDGNEAASSLKEWLLYQVYLRDQLIAKLSSQARGLLSIVELQKVAQ